MKADWFRDLVSPVVPSAIGDTGDAGNRALSRLSPVSPVVPGTADNADAGPALDSDGLPNGTCPVCCGTYFWCDDGPWVCAACEPWTRQPKRTCTVAPRNLRVVGHHQDQPMADGDIVEDDKPEG